MYNKINMPWNCGAKTISRYLLLCLDLFVCLTLQLHARASNAAAVREKHLLADFVVAVASGIETVEEWFEWRCCRLCWCCSRWRLWQGACDDQGVISQWALLMLLIAGTRQRNRCCNGSYCLLLMLLLLLLLLVEAECHCELHTFIVVVENVQSLNFNSWIESFFCFKSSKPHPRPCQPHFQWRRQQKSASANGSIHYKYIRDSVSLGLSWHDTHSFR